MEEREDIDITFSPDQVRALRDLLQQLKPEEDVENDLDYQSLSTSKLGANWSANY
tara:strand:+ start:7803 stop:7967 length:165 start_codon:yes stop_codon:yes gene_type:complete